MGYTHAAGWTALFEAATEGRVEVVAVLLAAGARVNDTDTWEGRTPLSLACARGSLELVQMLLDAGADPNIRCACVCVCVAWAASMPARGLGCP
jgi:ankyrin repeat protein